jgi:hypothetical protein
MVFCLAGDKAEAKDDAIGMERSYAGSLKFGNRRGSAIMDNARRDWFFENEDEAINARQIKNALKNVSLMLEDLPEYRCHIQINIANDNPSNNAAFAAFYPDREFLEGVLIALGNLYNRQCWR